MSGTPRHHATPRDRRRSRRPGALAALGACAAAAVVFGAPLPASAADPPTEFTLYAKELPADESDGSSESTDRPEVGDTFAFADDLYRVKDGPVVGRDGVSCVVVRASGSGGDMHCAGTLVLNGGPGGQIAAQGLTQFDMTDSAMSGYDIAVTGGTGDFKDARGYIRVTDEGDGYQKMDFRLTGR
ncbi:dirigent protein [Streptomyces sp. NPDC097619]|uniref:dirigent protein n=1 Tax=Streptomyces sp. NPDC097619 TaxID=3157228 RepID=UPI0033245830